MAQNKVHSNRLGRSHLSKRVVGVIVLCILLFLTWFNAGNEGRLRNTFTFLYNAAEQSASSAAIISAGDNRPDVDGKLRNATIPAKNVSLQTPFPTLPPPDIEEYIAICMAGEYLRADCGTKACRVLSTCRSQEPIHVSPRILHPLLFPPRHSSLLHF